MARQTKPLLPTFSVEQLVDIGQDLLTAGIQTLAENLKEKYGDVELSFPPTPAQRRRLREVFHPEEKADSFDPYVELGVSRADTMDFIEQAYRGKVLKCHPDKGGSTEEFLRTQAAIKIIRKERFGYSF